MILFQIIRVVQKFHKDIKQIMILRVVEKELLARAFKVRKEIRLILNIFQDSSKNNKKIIFNLNKKILHHFK